MPPLPATKDSQAKTTRCGELGRTMGFTASGFGDVYSGDGDRIERGGGGSGLPGAATVAVKTVLDAR